MPIDPPQLAPVLVTGATGFIGSHLVARLLASGASKVVALVRHTPETRPTTAENSGRLVVIEDDNADHTPEAIIEQHAIATVYHCATHYVAEHRPADVTPLVTSNILFGCRVADAVSRSPSVRMITLGTRWQYFHRHNVGYVAANLYAATKQAFQDILEYYADAHSRQFMVLDVGDTYGPNDRRNKLIPALVSAMRTGSALDLSPGEQMLDLLHVDDVTAAMIVAASTDIPMADRGLSLYSLQSPQLISVRELVAALQRVSNRAIAVNWGGKSYRGREVMRPSSPHPVLPMWTARIALDTGLRSLLATQ